MSMAWRLGLLCSLLACLIGGKHAAAQEMSLPAWAMQLEMSPQRNGSFWYNNVIASAANRSGLVYDVVFWGDSLTSLIPLYPDIWAKFGEHWGPAAGWTAAALGVGGSTVEELTWRMIAGGERFAQDPLVAVVLIGVNNQPSDNPGGKLSFLLTWMQAAMPNTRIMVVAPLPSVRRTSALLLQQYRPFLKLHPNVTLSLCGQDFNPASTVLFMDGLHLQAAGYERYWACLKPQLTALREASRAARNKKKRTGRR